MAASGLLLGGCGTVSLSLRPSAAPAADVAEAPAAGVDSTSTAAPALDTAPPDAVVPAAAPVTPPVAAAGDADATPAPPGPVVAQVVAQSGSSLAADTDDVYDPWESFNEKMFNVNRNLDKYALKPAANVYRHVMPEPFQIIIDNAFVNIRWVPRFINNLLQAKWEGAGREMARFLINSTAGVGGLFDPAKDYWGIKPSKEDFGQTLGVYGSGPGPYLILPLLPPMTVRDGIGMGVDGLLDPLGWFLPFFWDRLGMKAGDTLNDRALNYDLFQGVEETTIDLYSSVRHFYLKRREQLIKE